MIPSYAPITYHDSLTWHGISGKESAPQSARTPGQIKSPSRKVAVLETPLQSSTVLLFDSPNHLYNPNASSNIIVPNVHGVYITGWHSDGHVKSFNVLSELIYNDDWNIRAERWKKLFASDFP